MELAQQREIIPKLDIVSPNLNAIYQQALLQI